MRARDLAMSLLPAAGRDPPQRCTSCQHDTAAKAMCGSLASSGLPVTDFAAEMTQLLLPWPSDGSLIEVPTGCSPERAPGYEPGGKIASASASRWRKAR